MKTNFFKIILLTISFNALAIDLPEIQKPLELESGEYAEGTITTLSKDDLKEYLPWANNAKKSLEDALVESRRLPLRERMIFLENEVKSVVKTSAPKKYQQLMRFALNRGLLMVDIIEKEADSKEIGVIQNQLDILMTSIKTSFEFYESDLAFQKRVSEGNTVIRLPQAELGMKLAKSFLQSSAGVFDASAQYQVMRKTFEILNWDLSQDQNSKEYAEEIVDIFKVISNLPLTVKNDEEAIKHVRTMSYLKSKILSSHTLKKNDSIKQVNQQTSGPCGVVGTIEQRIDSCNTRKGNYALVMRNSAGKETYRDVLHGVYWSFDLGERTDRKDAIKACSDLTVNNLEWRLPTESDYAEAEINKIRESLDFKDKMWWSSSMGAIGSQEPWLFSGHNRPTGYDYRYNYGISVRCVSR